jgi:acetyltransferase-like isoleucine patch superfamily enzyme
VRTWLAARARGWFPDGSFGRWLMSTCGWNLPWALACSLKSLRATRRLTGKSIPVKVRIGPHAKLVVNRKSTGRADIQGVVVCFSWSGYRLPSSIDLCGTPTVHNESMVGPDVHIIVGKAGLPEVGMGRGKVPSAIQAKAIVLVEKSLESGARSGIGTGCFVSDSDWHFVAGSERSAPIRIGEHVWMPHDISVLKGAVIPDGCIVAARSVVMGGREFPERSLIAGAPAKLLKTDVEWDW